MSNLDLIARGRTAEIYAWGDGRVLKLFYDWCPQDWIDREARIAEWVAASGLRAPKFLGAAKQDGRSGILYERVDGPSMFVLMRTRLWNLKRYARLLADLHTQIHQVNADTLPPLKPRLEEAIRNEDAISQPIKDGVLEILRKLPDGSALCHFDFHPDQIVMSPSGPVIIDWMAAAQGHPLADVARTLVLVRFGAPLPMNPVMQWVVDAFRSTVYKEYKRAILALHPPADAEKLNLWMLVVAAHRLSEQIKGEERVLMQFLERAKKNKSINPLIG